MLTFMRVLRHAAYSQIPSMPSSARCSPRRSGAIPALHPHPVVLIPSYHMYRNSTSFLPHHTSWHSATIPISPHHASRPSTPSYHVSGFLSSCTPLHIIHSAHCSRCPRLTRCSLRWIPHLPGVIDVGAPILPGAICVGAICVGAIFYPALSASVLPSCPALSASVLSSCPALSASAPSFTRRYLRRCSHPARRYLRRRHPSPGAISVGVLFCPILSVSV
jgi:hypothetical protein